MMNTKTVARQAQRIVERDLHVSETVRSAARYVISRLRGGYPAYRELPRPVRRALWRGAAAGTRSNLALYWEATRSRA